MKQKFTFTDEETAAGRLMAAVSYLSIVGFIIAYFSSRENRYVRYHAQQSMALIIMLPFIIIPVLGWILLLSIIIFSIMGIRNALTDKPIPVPVFGSLGYRFELLLPTRR